MHRAGECFQAALAQVVAQFLPCLAFLVKVLAARSARTSGRARGTFDSTGAEQNGEYWMSVLGTCLGCATDSARWSFGAAGCWPVQPAKTSGWSDGRGRSTCRSRGLQTWTSWPQRVI